MQRVSPKETLQEKRKDKDMFLKINVENPFHLSAQAVAPLEALAVLARRGALRGSVAPPRPRADTAPCGDSRRDRLNTGSERPAALMLQP